MQAQPKKARLNEGDEARYQQKLLLKAEIIINSANRIWGVYFDLPPIKFWLFCVEELKLMKCTEREQQQQRIDIEADL